MPKTLRNALLLPAALLLPQGLGAQTYAGFRAGLVTSSDLVEDVIVTPITVAPNTAPMLAFSLEFGVGRGFRFGGEIAYSRSDLETEMDGQNVTLTSLRVWSPAVKLRRELVKGLSVWGTAGAIIYDPEDDTGIFALNNPTEAKAGLGVTLERNLLSHILWTFDATWDVHRFSTDVLRAQGFNGKRTVHRFGLGIGIMFRHAKEAR